MAAKGKRADRHHAPPQRRSPGRPTIYTEAVLRKILDRLSLGEPLAVICRDDDLPARSTVDAWAASDTGISSALARAREAGEEVLAAQCLEIANTPMEGEALEMGIDPESGEEVVVKRKREDMLGHRKLQIETRLKLLAIWNPKKYGNRQTIEHEVGNLADMLKEARERAAGR